MRNMRLGSGQQKAVSTKEVVVGRVMNGEVDDEKERLCLFGNSTSADIFFSFLHYGLLSGFHDLNEKSIIQYAHLDAWVLSLLT